ncbi:cellulose synthase [Nocardioides sp. dk4132]|uniref:cellulose synthase n=1 Tax=unclassified Nocardioides TaxID=2615069 RepID=UPI00129755A0|nr:MULTISPECIES: cellulose synthase [unclassified Nocardioides]MQW76232.1 cellulose synthase [Nocardioides sp. dk4132]QGA07477.1 cellulose synthase [Nocardioides sp. dk884]
MDDVTWTALTLTLTLLAGIWTWFAFRRRGLAAGLRGAGITLLPLAAYLTDTLRMFTRIVDAVSDWAVRLAFSPTVWAGVVLAGVGVALIVVAGLLDARTDARPATRASRRSEALPGTTKGAKKGTKAAPGGTGDKELDEIEAMLRKRGIS